MSSKEVKLSERLRRPPAEDVIEYFTKLHLKSDVRMLQAQLEIHKAHVIMLLEEKIITKEQASRILEVIREIERGGAATLEVDPKKGDIYSQTEAYLIKRIGEDIGGRMHTARSRNDLFSCHLRMVSREAINSIILEIIKLRKALLELAKQHTYTIMPGYTHMQHAQPITLAHYALAITDQSERDILRLECCYERTNLSPMGACALAGTSFAIDRARVAELLGFEGVLENTLDAVSSRDVAAELISELAVMMSGLSRFAMDLLTWGTFEYSVTELADEYASVSSIMPQKKNLVSLESIRATTAFLIGTLTSALTVLKALPIGMHRDICYIDHAFWDAVDRSVGMVKILTGIVSTLKVNVNLLAERALEGFSTVTDLADTLVREKGLSFRTAHKIVGAIVARAIDEGKLANQITSQMIDDVAQEQIGRRLNLSEESLRKALDPKENVETRRHIGGPAPQEVERMIADREKRIAAEEIRLENRKRSLEKARGELNRMVESLLR